MAEWSHKDMANRQQKLGLVWRNRKKISQIIKDYFYLPIFLLIILCLATSGGEFTVTDLTRAHLLIFLMKLSALGKTVDDRNLSLIRRIFDPGPKKC
jgi:hypothetical protein